MNQFPYENLNDEEFENLAFRICKEILGIGCKTFSICKDGEKGIWLNRKWTIFKIIFDHEKSASSVFY
jgi:hypothetical protein